MRKRTWPTFWLRFWEQVERGQGCWLWTGLQSAGYGQIRTPDGQDGAHRVSYKWAFGEIPEGLMVLHRCNVKLCVRPGHLYAGNGSENAEDARVAGTLPEGHRHGQRRKTHCPQGHPYDEANTKWYDGRRYCRACHKAHSLKYARKGK